MIKKKPSPRRPLKKPSIAPEFILKERVLIDSGRKEYHVFVENCFEWWHAPVLETFYPELVGMYAERFSLQKKLLISLRCQFVNFHFYAGPPPKINSARLTYLCSEVQRYEVSFE